MEIRMVINLERVLIVVLLVVILIQSRQLKALRLGYQRDLPESDLLAEAQALATKGSLSRVAIMKALRTAHPALDLVTAKRIVDQVAPNPFADKQDKE